MAIQTEATDLPPSTAWLFPEHTFAQMDTDGYATVIIERTLARGSWAQIRWLFEKYDRPVIAGWVRQHGYHRLDKRAFHYWRWMLGIHEYRKPPWESQSMQSDSCKSTPPVSTQSV